MAAAASYAVNVMDEALHGLCAPVRAEPQRQQVRGSVGATWARHSTKCKCERCARKRTARHRAGRGARLPPIAAADGLTTVGGEDPRVQQLLSGVRSPVTQAFAQELLLGWVADAVDVLAPKPATLQTHRSDLPAPDVKRTARKRTARMAPSPLLDGGDTMGSSYPGFADTTDYSREQYRNTAMVEWCQQEKEEMGRSGGRRRGRRTCSSYKLPHITSSTMSTTAGGARSSRDREIVAAAVAKPTATQTERPAVEQAEGIADDREGERDSGDHGNRPSPSSYMLAGCACTSYTRRQAAATTAAATTTQAHAATPTNSAVIAAAGAAPAAVSDVQWLRPPQHKPKALPTVGAWRQTWLYRAPPIDRLSNGIRT